MSPQRLEDHDERQRRLDADPWLALVSRPRAALFLARILALALLGAVLILTFAPWQQFSTASGRVVAYAPALRRQSIDAPVDGRVVRWFVAEGALVRQGEPIVALEDNDPDLVERMRMQLESHRLRADSMAMRRQSLEERITSIRASREVALMSADQRIDMARERLTAAQTDEAAAAAQLEAATLHAQRQRGLAEQGLASSRTLELAELDLRQSQAALDRGRASRRAAESELRSLRADRDRIALDASAQIDSALSELRQAEAGEQDARIALATFESQLARQQTQVVTAPRDGRVQTIMHGEGGSQVRAGTRLATFVPTEEDLAVELFVRGVDAPLVYPGRKVRLQFEGWPSVQFVGWPGMHLGTFGGVVDFVDAADDGFGRFRIIVVPDPDDQPWPTSTLLRQGVRTNAWILLDEVRLGYEIWRRVNGFPPNLPHRYYGATDGDASSGSGSGSSSGSGSGSGSGSSSGGQVRP